jgi:hypothetical protein
MCWNIKAKLLKTNAFGDIVLAPRVVHAGQNYVQTTVTQDIDIQHLDVLDSLYPPFQHFNSWCRDAC